MGCPFKVSVELWSLALASPLSFHYQQMTCWLGLCSLNAGRPTPCIPATLYPFPTAHLAPAFPTVTTHPHPDLLLCFFFVALTPQLWQLTLAILAGPCEPRDPALLSLDQFLALPGHCLPWEGPHLQSWGHCFYRDPFCLLKACYLVIKVVPLAGAFFMPFFLETWRWQAGSKVTQLDTS